MPGRGTAALIATTIKSYEVVAYGDLGPKALARMEVVDFPAIVAIDRTGRNFYHEGQKAYREDYPLHYYKSHEVNNA